MKVTNQDEKNKSLGYDINSKGYKAHVKTKQLSNSGVVSNVYATSGIYLTFTVKTQSNNLIRDKKILNKKDKFKYEIINMDIKSLPD